MNRFSRVVRPAPKPQTPIEALQLAEDMQRIEMAMGCLRKLSPGNVCECRADGEMQMRSWLATLETSRRHAELRLRRDFLSVEVPPK
jgi:hypothetical protein